jgi:hypothetical protein
MEPIDALRAKFAKDEFEFSKHATDQSLLREITVQEIREAVRVGEIIEDYPEDKYGPSCLIFGLTSAKRAVHVQCTHASRGIVKVITVYEPDAEEWIDYRVRRK